jgi:hypothetical protein
VKPHCAIVCAAAADVVPSAAGPTFIAKYTPGIERRAAISAMMPTSDSVSMPP